MSKSRSLLFGVFMTVAAGGAAESAFAELLPAERGAAASMAARGVGEFLLLNKATGNLKIVRDGAEAAAFPALSGKLKGDEPRDKLRVTPAGIYPLAPEDDEHQKYPSVAYLKIGKVSYVIHPVSGGRAPLLMKDNPEKRRVTAGCVNVDRKTFREIWKFATGPTEILYDEKGTPLVESNFFVVLPELKFKK